MGNADCESGQRGWLDRQAVDFPKEVEPGVPFKIAFDSVSPGVQGKTYRGRDRVYPGQTFTRNPETGIWAERYKASEYGGK